MIFTTIFLYFNPNQTIYFLIDKQFFVLNRTIQMSSSHNPTRQQIKQEQKAFIKSSQQAMQKVSTFLQNRLIHAVMNCDSSQCVNRVTKNIDEVEFEMKKFMDTLALGVEKCISIEANRGIKGYSKCFKMYEYLLNYQVNNTKLLGL